MKLCQFYGWTPGVALNLSNDLAETFYLGITVIEAQELLVQMRLSDYPRLETADRRKWHSEIHRLAYTKTYSKPLTTVELFEKLKGLNG